MGEFSFHFDTSAFHPRERADAWQDMVARTCCPYVIDFGAGRGGFRGEIDSRDITGLACVRIRSNSGAARRTRHEVDRCDPRLLYLILQLRGTMRMAQAGEEVLLRPGALALIDSGRPCAYSYVGESECLNLHIPRELLLDRWKPVALPLARPLGGPAASVTGDLMRSAFEHAELFRALEASGVREALLSLVRATLFGGPAEILSDRPQLAAVQDFIACHLEDPALTPGTIARAHGISVRHLHRLFGGTGMTVGDWIRQRRLAQCARDLRDPALRRLSVTEICYRWGFNDSAHFSRSFKSAFGRAPRDYRAGDETG